MLNKPQYPIDIPHYIHIFPFNQPFPAKWLCTPVKLPASNASTTPAALRHARPALFTCCDGQGGKPNVSWQKPTFFDGRIPSCFDNVLLLKNTTLDVYAEINMHMFHGLRLREICSPFWMVNHLKSPLLMTKSLLVSCQIPFFDMWKHHVPWLNHG